MVYQTDLAMVHLMDDLKGDKLVQWTEEMMVAL